MISEAVKEYVKSLIFSHHDEYPYYVAYTYTNVGTGYSAYDLDTIYVILSDEPIMATGRYNFKFSGNCIAYALKSGNASSSYQSERLRTYSAPSSLNINTYEFVYTNAEFTGETLQPDLLAGDYVHQSHFDGLSIAVLIVLLSVLVFRLIRR